MNVIASVVERRWKKIRISLSKRLGDKFKNRCWGRKRKRYNFGGEVSRGAILYNTCSMQALEDGF